MASVWLLQREGPSESEMVTGLGNAWSEANEREYRLYFSFFANHSVEMAINTRFSESETETIL